MVLVFGFGFPEVTGGLQFRYHSARPKPGCVHVGNRLFRNPFLLLACVKDGRTVAGSPVVPLAVERGRVEIRIADAEGTADHFGRFMVLPYGNIMILWFQRTVICSRTVTCYYLSRPGS